MKQKNTTGSISKNTLKTKGSSEMWWIIMGATIAIIVLVLLIVWFRGSGGKGFDVINDNIDGTKDCDKDKIANLFDKCPCKYGDENNKEAEGCPIGTPANSDKSCYATCDQEEKTNPAT